MVGTLTGEEHVKLFSLFLPLTFQPKQRRRYNILLYEPVVIEVPSLQAMCVVKRAWAVAGPSRRQARQNPDIFNLRACPAQNSSFRLRAKMPIFGPDKPVK